MDDLEDMMKSMFKLVSKINPQLLFRDKERRRRTSITSRCCEYPLPVWDKTNKKNEKVFEDLAYKCVKRNERNPFYGIYGASGAGKSHFIDHFCNEREFNGRHTIEFTPISLRRMKVQEQEPKPQTDKKRAKVEMNISREQIDSYQRMLAIRILFSYFFEINAAEMKASVGGNDKPNGSFSGFEAYWKLLTEQMIARKVDPAFVVGLVGNEIKQLKNRRMIIVVDDITRLGITQQKEFISSLRSLGCFVIFSTTFRGDEKPLYYKVNNPSGDYCRWKQIGGTNLTQTVKSHLCGGDDELVDGNILELVLTQFGDHSRSYGVFYHAFKNEFPLRECCREGQVSKILNYFIAHYWEPGCYGPNGSLNSLMSRGKSRNFLLLLSAAMLKIPLQVLVKGGLMTENDQWEFFEAGIIFGSNTINIHPICLNAWAVHTKEKREEARKDGITCEDSFSDCLSSLFDICNIKFSSNESEALIMLLIFLRLNCAKLLVEHGIDEQFLTSQKILGFHSDRIDIDYVNLPWSAIGKGKLIGLFAGIDNKVWQSYTRARKKQNDIRVKIDEKALVEQLNKVDLGITSTLKDNVAFDLLLVVPVKVQQNKDVTIEEKNEETETPKGYIFFELKSKFALFHTMWRDLETKNHQKHVAHLIHPKEIVKMPKEEKNRTDEQFGKFCEIMHALDWINVNGCDGGWVVHLHNI